MLGGFSALYGWGCFAQPKVLHQAGEYALEQAEDQDGVPLQVQHPAPESDVVVF